MGNSMVIRTGCRLGAVLMLLAACQRVSLPDSASQGSIGFDAGIGLLQENGTKSELDTRSTFSNGDSFRVFGRRVGEGQVTRILDGAQVTYNQAQDKWSYNPETYWHWVNRTNYYDFLAVYPDPADANQSHRMVDGAGRDIPGNLAVQKPYRLSDDYDLLMAGTRRQGANEATRSLRVPLTFRHMLCAVKVNVKNESASYGLSLNSVKFDNLVQRAKAKVTIDALGEPEFSWIDTERNSEELAVLSAPTNLASGESFETAEYTLFIPCDLAVAIDGSTDPAAEGYRDLVPHLIINYTGGGDSAPRNVPIPLLDIQKTRHGTQDPISVWEPGIKYAYNITIRLNGDVLVTVVTTEWDEVQAETPGLLIE